MRPVPRIPLLLALFSFAALAVTQEASTSTSQRDPQALGILTQSLNAMGGPAGVGAIQNCSITGTIQINATDTSAARTKKFTWITAGSEFREEIDFNMTANVFVSGHGSPANIRNGIATRINYHVARANLPFYLPALVLQNEMNNVVYTVRYIGSARVEGKSAIQIHVSDDSDRIGSLVSPQEWYFDASSFLPLRVEYRLPSNQNAEDFATAAFEFSNFQMRSGLLVPVRLGYFQDGTPVGTVTVSSVTFNSALPSTTFDAPAGGGQ